jgi:uncharacterized protein (DUF2147 family)
LHRVDNIMLMLLRRRSHTRFIFCFVAFASMIFAPRMGAQTSPLFGDWREPGGSILQIGPCSTGVCLHIVVLRANAPATTDVHNPDAAQRSRSLCGLTIGSQFHLADATHASGGMLYDPQTGKTYRGSITAEGDSLRLRGYIGMPLFGRSEIWKRVSNLTGPCRA